MSSSGHGQAPRFERRNRFHDVVSCMFLPYLVLGVLALTQDYLIHPHDPHQNPHGPS